MARLVLHIGTRHTGASALQACLAGCRADLARANLIYPLTGKETGHDRLFGAGSAPARARIAAAEAVLAALAQAHPDPRTTVLISAEALSLSGQMRADFGALRRVAAQFDGVEVLCLLRDQAELLEAACLDQAARTPKPPAQVLEEALSRHATLGLWTDYTRLHAHLRRAFAPEEITFLDHRAAAAHPQGVTGAVLDHLGVRLPEGLAPSGPTRSPLAPLAVLAARMVSAPAAAPAWLTAAMEGALTIHYGPDRAACLWRRDELEQLRLYADAVNAGLTAALAAEHRPGPGLRAAAPPRDPLHPEDLSADFWRRANRWMFLAKPAYGRG